MPSTPLLNGPEAVGEGDTERPPPSSARIPTAVPVVVTPATATPPVPPGPPRPRVPTILHAGAVPPPPLEPPPVPLALTRRCTSCNERYPADFLVCPRDASPLVDETGGDADPLVGKLIN